MSSLNKGSLIDLARRFWQSVWLFPVLLAVPLILFTALGINGSSGGTYHNTFYGNDTRDPDILVGGARSIRSDEWLVNTQLTIAQKNNEYERINTNIGDGHDMSVAVDAPYIDWSALFKPHNLAFFALPFDNAFAFKWWVNGFLLITSCYFLVIALLPKKRLWASILGLTIFFNPFIQWWYLPGTMAPLYFSLFGILTFMKVVSSKRRLHTILWGALLTYLVTCFVLVLYPPFQIPCAIVAGSFVVGYLFNKRRDLDRNVLIEKLAVLVVATIIAGALSVAYLYTRQDVVNTLRGTAYPGVRMITSGLDDAFNKSFSSPLSFALQSETTGASYFTNYYTSQSEAASFIKINFIFAPVILLLAYRRSELRKTPPYNLFIATSVALALLSIRIFTPFFDWPFRLLLLNQVQNERLEIGLLLLCIIQIALLGALLLKAKGELVTKKIAILTAVAAVALFGDASFSMLNRYPLFISRKYLVVFVIVGIGASLYLMLRRKTYTWGIGLFLAINVCSSIAVNPLYKTVEPKSVSAVTDRIRNNYPDNKSWAVFDNLVIENIPQISDKRSLTGVYSYPQLNLWSRLDSNDKEKYEYNRYSHTAFTVTANSDSGRFSNPSADILLVSFDCEMAKKLPNFGYALSAIPIKYPHLDCLIQTEKIEYPNITLYIYRYSP